MAKNTKPAIRFKGFTDDWEQRKLGELASLITKGTTPLDKSGDGEINFIKVENIDSASGEITPEMKISEAEHNGYLKRSQLQEHDILFSIAGTLGRVSIVKSSFLPANTNQALAIIRTKEGDLNYLTTVLKGNAVADFIKRNPTIGAQPNLSLEQVGNLKIPYSSMKEQAVIGAYFKYLDHLITLHQRKYDSLVNVKKAMLEKMFPKNGETVPEIRFKGFTDAWEQRKLGEVATEMIAGGDVDKELLLEEGHYPVIANALTNDGIVGYYNDQYRIKAPAVTVTGRGDVGHAKARNVDFTPVVRLLSIKTNHDVYFLENAINTLKIVIESTGVPQLTVPQLAKYEISFPKALKEEEKIGQYFANLDHLITLHQRKLEKLKNIKKSCLEKMFV